MSAVPSAMAALDSHRGVAVVAQYGLGFLYNQSFAAENRVRLGVPGSVVGPRHSVRSTGGHVSDVLSCTYAGLVWWEGGLGWAEANVDGQVSASWMCGDGGGGGDGYQ
jgi:hypothetical protein